MKISRLTKKFINEFKPISGDGYKSKAKQFIEIIQMLLYLQLTPEEYYLYKFHKKDVDRQYMFNYINNYQKLHYLRPVLNSAEWGFLFQNKLIFNSYYKSHGFPVTNIYGFYDHNAGYTKSGNPLRNADDLKELLLHIKPQTLVAKPVGGCEGRGVIVINKVLYDKKDIGFVDGANREISFHDLVSHLNNNSFNRIYSGYVLEEKVLQHDLASSLNATSLNTLRVVTLLKKNYEVDIHIAVIRVGRAGSWTNNVAQGGYFVKIDPLTGRLDGDIVRKDLIYGNQKVNYEHKIDLNGLVIPFWDEIVKLCCKAAKVSPFCRDLGWDIAITANGPVFVEGSHVHDLFVQQICHGFLKPGIRESLMEFGLVFPENRFPKLRPLELLKAMSYWSGR